MSMQVGERSRWIVPCPMIGGVRQMAHSVVGQLGFSVIAELTGACAAREAARKIMVNVGSYIAPCVVPLLNEKNLLLVEVIAMTTLALKVKNFHKQIATALGLTLATTHLAFELYPNWTQDGAESFGQTVQKIASLVGENLGGFVGLTVAAVVFNRKGFVYWDQEHPEGSYAVSMARYQIAGIYDQIVNPKLLILKPPCMLGGIIFKTAAYNSHVLIPFIQRLIGLIQKKESPKKILQPLVFQMISRRYFQSTTTPVRQDRFYLIFFDFFKQVGKTLIEQTPANVAAKIDADQLATRVLLRAFKNYVALVRNTPEIVNAHREFMNFFEEPLKAELLKACLQEQVRKNPTVTKAVRNKTVDVVFSDEKLQTITDDFIEEMLQMEREFWGLELFTDKNKLLLKKLLPIHLKFFINYMCLHFSRLTHSDLEECEDMQLMLELNHLILSGYFALILPKPIHGRLHAISDSVAVYVADFQRIAGVLIHRNEQSSSLMAPVVVLDAAYCPIPDRTEAEIANLKKQLAFFKAQDAQSVKREPIEVNDSYCSIPDPVKVKKETLQIVEGYDIIERTDEKK